MEGFQVATTLDIVPFQWLEEEEEETLFQSFCWASMNEESVHSRSHTTIHTIEGESPGKCKL